MKLIDRIALVLVILGGLNWGCVGIFGLDLVAALRAARPDLALSTDLIVGFPGETDEDFEDTCALARRVGFSKIHVFPYSKREGTPAAARADQVPPEVKAARAARLRALSDELAAADRAAAKRGEYGMLPHDILPELGALFAENQR